MKTIRVNHQYNGTSVFYIEEDRIERMFYINKELLKKSVKRFLSGMAVDLALSSDKFTAALFQDLARFNHCNITFKYREENKRREIIFIRYTAPVRAQTCKIILQEILEA